MEQQGEWYFVSVDYKNHDLSTIVKTANDKCVTLEWIFDRIYNVLHQDGSIISFWDCCQENALKAAMPNRIVRGNIRKMDQLEPENSNIRKMEFSGTCHTCFVGSS